MLMCQSCKLTLFRYVAQERSYFFSEAKKMLIQYFIPIGEAYLIVVEI